MRNALIFIAAAVLAVWATFALADPRMDSIQSAWNRGDTYAVQHGFAASAVLSQAGLAHEAEQGGTLTLGAPVLLVERVYGVLAMHNGKAETWIFVECKDSTQWCAWGSRPAVGVMGGAEIGQAADVATTAVGVGLMGAVEANPLGLALIPLKLGAMVWSRTADFQSCVDWRSSLDSIGLGAGVANVITLAMGISNPIAPILMVMAGALLRQDAAMETAYYECAGFALGVQQHG